jgi:threonine aldolase
MKPLANDRFGAIDPDDVARAINPDDQHYARTGLLCLENTHNVSGGIAIPVDAIQAIADVAHNAGIPVHLDGSRLWHASVALDAPLEVLAGPCDTVQVCLSKGLAAPVGSMLAGPRDVIKDARRHRKILGGAMRQAGVLAAAGLVALDEIYPRLDEDHRNARRLAEGLAELPGVSVDLETVQTNLVYAKFPAALPGHELEAQLRSEGILIGAYDPKRVRFALHYQIDQAGVDRTLSSIKRLVARAA